MRLTVVKKILFTVSLAVCAAVRGFFLEKKENWR